VRFSPPLPHGSEGSGFGYVVAVTVDDGYRFVHASDLQGPASPVATAYLLRERPDLVYVSGPPTYLQGQVGREVLQRGIDNIIRLVGETGCRVIVDHHAVREPRFRDRLRHAFDTARVMTAAEYLGRGDECLEARRAALWARRRGRQPDTRASAAGP
jgi:predicted metallo-beta-lactamase superfamily hydrolase